MTPSVARRMPQSLAIHNATLGRWGRPPCVTPGINAWRLGFALRGLSLSLWFSLHFSLTSGDSSGLPNRNPTKIPNWKWEKAWRKPERGLGSKSNLCFVEARFHGTCRRHSTPLLLRLGNETIIAWCLHSIFGKCICSDQAAGHIAGAKFNTEMNRRENHENSSASLAIYPCNLDL